MNMADKKTINEINESSSGYNDEAIAAEEKAKREAHIFEGYKIAIDNIDEVIHIIRSSASVSSQSSPSRKIR